MWIVKKYDSFEKRLKKFAKKHRVETRNALDNLNAFFVSLKKGLKPKEIVRGYIHPEPKGVLAFDESGPGNPQKAVRLYAYPEEPREVLHVLTLGDKSTQVRDIAECSEFVDDLREKIGPDTEQKTISEPEQP